MHEVLSAEHVKNLMTPFLEKGFTLAYFYQKGGDSSCVYVYRFKKGNSFFDWREVSGADEVHFVVNVNGTFSFPSLQKRYAKQMRKFRFAHLFKRATMDQRRAFFAQLLVQELQNSEVDFFGIPL